MPITDYSKWEKMDLSDVVEEEDRPRKPRVTRLEGPSRITLGAPEAPVPDSGPVPHTSGKPPRDALDYSKWEKMVDDEDEDESEDEASMDDPAGSVGSAPAARTSAFGYSYPASTNVAEAAADAFEEDALDPQEEERLREVLSTPSISAPPPSAMTPEERLSAASARLSRNGAVRATHLWRQTADEVEISILVPPGTRAKQVRPQLIPPQEPTGAPTLLVERTGAPGLSAFFRGVLAHPVETPEEAGELNWEITDYEPDALGGRRVVRVSLQKRPMQGVVVWWTRALENEPEIDTLSLPDRKRTAGAEQMQSVWEQAQAMFKEKVANRQPHEVVLGDEPFGDTPLGEASGADESRGLPSASEAGDGGGA